MEQTTEIEVKQTAAISTEVYDYGDDVDQGYGPDTLGDIQLPRLSILQPMSKAVEEVEGASPGKLFNTVTKEVMDSRRFVIAMSEKCYNEWIPFDDDGGFVARHEMGSKVVKDARRANPRGAITLDNGNDLKETVYLYILPVDENDKPLGSFEVIDFTSAKLKSWRGFNTLLQTFTVPTKVGKRHPPLFSHVVEMTSLKVKGPKATYYVPKLASANPGGMKSSLLSPDAPAYLEAKALLESVKAGLLKVDNSSGGEEPSAAAPESSEAPF